MKSDSLDIATSIYTGKAKAANMFIPWIVGSYSAVGNELKLTAACILFWPCLHEFSDLLGLLHIFG